MALSCIALGCTSSVIVGPEGDDTGLSDADTRGRDASTTPHDGGLPTMPLDSGRAFDDGGVEGDAFVSDVVDELRRGVFDPERVYLAGTLSEGACYRDAVADYRTPDHAAVGFECEFDERGAVISAAGVLTYTNTFEDRLREFVCDDCPGFVPGDDYPSDVLDNDPVLATPPCTGDRRALDFRLGPDGARIHRCGLSSPWYDATGAEILPAGDVLALGWSAVALTEGEVHDTVSGEVTPLSNFPSDCRPVTARAGPTPGFRVAVDCEEVTELWWVDHAGAAVREGVYPPPPADYPPWFEGRLAGDGTLVQLARGPETFEDTIIERTVSGRSELIYTEARSPAVKIHISSLVTGP